MPRATGRRTRAPRSLPTPSSTASSCSMERRGAVAPPRFRPARTYGWRRR